MTTASRDGEVVDLLFAHSDAAAITVVAEDCEGALSNVYTTVLYGRDEDMRSFPRQVEVTRAGDLTVLRLRATKEVATRFVEQAASGRAALDGNAVTYALGPPIASFRANTFETTHPRQPIVPGAHWGRERRAAMKTFRGVPLSFDSLAVLACALKELDARRVATAPITRHVLKLGDLDELFLTPLDVHARGGSEVVLDLRWCGVPLTGDVTLHVTHYHDQLETGHDERPGLALHRLPAADAIEYEVRLDGRVLLRDAGTFVRQVNVRMGVNDGPHVRFGDRDPYDFSLTAVPRTATTTSAGTSSPEKDLRLLELGYALRNRGERRDFWYDPRKPGAVERYFRDLQGLADPYAGPEILVVDPYALDERALLAIAALAAGRAAGANIAILTALRAPPGTQTASAAPTDTRSAFFATAQRVASALQCTFDVRELQGVSLHDRFLRLGNRMWHVGHSFNALGSSLSAMIEIGDPVVVSELFSTFSDLISKAKSRMVRP